MFKHLTQVAETSGQLTHVRGMGAVVAADFYQIALQNGALWPIGNLNADAIVIEKLADITLKSIKALYQANKTANK